MRLLRRRLGSNSSGQLLIVAALTIAVLISSTTMYVYDLTRETTVAEPQSISDLIMSIRQSTRNALISSLANVSNGGPKTAIVANMNGLSDLLRNLRHLGTCNQAFAALNDSKYDSGSRLTWNEIDSGVSSAYANFTLTVYGTTARATTIYAVNVTTAVTLKGFYSSLSGIQKRVNATCKVYNENSPALVRNLRIYYSNAGNWTLVGAENSLTVVNSGNGSYGIGFTVSVSSSTVDVSASVHDLRGIFVKANTTCVSP